MNWFRVAWSLLKRAQIGKIPHGIAAVPALGRMPDQIEQPPLGAGHFRQLDDGAGMVFGVEIDKPAALAHLTAHFRLETLPQKAFQIVVVPFGPVRSEEHTSELQSLMRISY